MPTDNQQPAIDLDSLIERIQYDPNAKEVIEAVKPYLPAIQRLGAEAFEDLISYASARAWIELDRKMWPNLTEDERDMLSNNILKDARKAVDNMYERNQAVKSMVMRAVLSIALAAI